MAKMVFGDDFVDQNCVMINLINANSPLVFDSTMVGALKVYARANQATVISPFILSGAMSAVTVIGTLTQILAEASVGMAFAQLCRPGAPVVFGTFASSISMQSGAPTFGTPEPAHVLFGAAQLARRLGVPFRSGGGLCASKLPDAQAAHESSNTLWPTLLGGVNFVLHAAGWLEGGLVLRLRETHHRCRPADDAPALRRGRRLMRERPGARCHPRSRSRQPFSRLRPYPGQFRDRLLALGRLPTTIPSSNGATTAKDIAQRANALWKRQLREYEAPPLDPAIDEALNAFMAKRKAVLPDTVA